MSWETTRAQWLAWLEHDGAAQAGTPGDPLDDELRQRLARSTFVVRGETPGEPHPVGIDQGDDTVELEAGEVSVEVEAPVALSEQTTVRITAVTTPGADEESPEVGSMAAESTSSESAFHIPPLVRHLAANAPEAHSQPALGSPILVAPPASGARSSGGTTAAAGEIVSRLDPAPVPATHRPQTPKVVVSESLADVGEEPADEVEPDEFVDDGQPESQPESRAVPPTPPAPPAEPTRSVAPPPPARAAASSFAEPPPPPRPAPAPETHGAGQPWYREVFGEHYAALEGRGYLEKAEHEAAFCTAIAALTPGASVLDVGCGSGVHAAVLARQGYAPVGLDLSEPQLRRAERRARQLGVNLPLVHADMRDFRLEQTFDAVLCVGTTLGYFDDEGNAAAVRAMAAHLRPGGRLVLQVINRDYIISRLPARSWWQGRGCLVLDEAEMNYWANRVFVRRTMVFEDGRQFDHKMVIRAYGLHELIALCQSVGLRAVEVSGSRHARGRFYGATSSEIWLVAESAH